MRLTSCLTTIFWCADRRSDCRMLCPFHAWEKSERRSPTSDQNF